MNKVIFLDRDGVINREIGNYIYNLKDFVINDGLEQALDFGVEKVILLLL